MEHGAKWPDELLNYIITLLVGTLMFLLRGKLWILLVSSNPDRFGHSYESSRVITWRYPLPRWICLQDIPINCNNHHIFRYEEIYDIYINRRPTLKDKQPKTKHPASALPSQWRPYSGKLVNSGIAWGVTDTVLKLGRWNHQELNSWN